MAFTVNTNDTQEQQGLMKPGDYEVVIKEVKEGQSQQKGTPYIQIELVVRNDINQEYKNKYLWYTIWDTPTTREKGIYAKQINTVSKHAGIQNGATFNSFQDWGKFLFGRPMLATVKLEEYNGEQKERVSFLSATKFPQCQHNFRVEGQGNTSNNQGSNQQYGNQNQSNYGTGSQQPSQAANPNYNNGQQGNPSNQGYGNQNGGAPNQGNYYPSNNVGTNVAGTGQGWQGNQPQNNVQQPQSDDDLPF
ncbi:DUF669 domain-containing protein [Cellulosilyticum sp. ST5]|uniref:DUF669 domain-containing protein n=1 Tax=Cellulosilyticum sp. ST5 TaxID=3055805 RepID=UPI0039772F08